MKIIFRQTELYKFLKYCEGIDMEKKVLDCGAGGNCPPLALFSEYGYKTCGIELSDFQMKRAKDFSDELGLELNIQKGDMRKLPFENESFSFVYSYNTIFHMTKQDIAIAVNEIKRVLKPGGICFINFLTLNNELYGIGDKVGDGEFLQEEGDEKIIHSYLRIDKTDAFFKDMKLLFREDRTLNRIFDGRLILQGYIDYIVQKH